MNHTQTQPTSWLSRLTSRNTILSVLGCAGGGLIVIFILGGYALMTVYPYIFTVLIPTVLYGIIAALSNIVSGYRVAITLKVCAIIMASIALMFTAVFVVLVPQLALTPT